MTRLFQISADWENLGEGSPEERSCFAALGIRANELWLTEGHDALANRLRQAPFLSAYHLAEWFAWNWWRLRWEPRSASQDWNLAHRMTSIGDGYIWPDLTIFSDGQRTALISKAGRHQENSPFRYITESAAVLPSSEFESEVDQFVGQVLERLEACDVRDSNLSTLWQELTLERMDSGIARVRKLEALLGLQPDQLDDVTRVAFLNWDGKYGEGAIDELAADQGNTRSAAITRPDELAAEAKSRGYATKPCDVVALQRKFDLGGASSGKPAWQLGALLAQMLRAQENLEDDAVITDKLLSGWLSVDQAALSGTETTGFGVSYLHAEKDSQGQVMLRSKWKTGRRFELARLLGDCLLGHAGTLHPATRAYTYRQKVQRAFAAELLSPFSAVFNHLQGDYSPEAQANVADHFNVSELTIRTQLVNHRALERNDLDDDAEKWHFAA